ncbi:MAG: phage tail assembly chaperone [Mesorhizobium sp.]
MTMGLGLLRLGTEDFWAMTPREFERAACALLPAHGEPPDAGDLARLMRLFPDGGKDAWTTR